MRRKLPNALALAALSACGSPECPSGTVAMDGRCIDAMDAGPRPDAFTPDVSGDAPGLDVNLPDAWEPDAWTADDAWAPDVGNDGGVCSRCPVESPACFMDGCVECTDDSHCVGHANGPSCDTSTHLCVGCTDPVLHCAAPLAACVGQTCLRCDGREDCGSPTPACVANSCVQCEGRGDCTAPTPACVANSCRQCDASTDCGTASASRCDLGTNACAACMGDGDCGHIAGNPRCVAGTCRPCTVATEAVDCATPATSCNPVTNVCGTRMRGSVTVCNRCDADSECGAMLTCAAVNPARGTTGNYCLPRLPGPGDFCTRPYFDRVVSGTSVSGATVTYCRSQTTTCEAVLQHRTTGDGTCTASSGTDDSCGAPSVNDGLCRLSGGGNRCTIPCGSEDDCPGGFACDVDGTVPVFGKRCAI